MIELNLLNESESIELKLEENSKGGTKNYNELDNKPQINGKTLQGNLTLEDLSIIVNAVKDVLINGTSIVDENGVANIPVATSNNLGLVSIESQQGINAHASGRIYVNKAENSEIDARANGYKPIVPKNLPYAVKSAMTSTTDEAWTSEEKANARARMGVDTWEVLADMTLEEDVNSIEVNTDLNGNSFQVRKMRITFTGAEIATNARLNLFSNPTNYQADRNMQNTYFYQAITVGKTKKCVVEIGERLSSGVCIVNCQATEYGLDSAYTLAVNDFKAIATRENEFLDRIKMGLPTDGIFKNGVRVVVEGVRA